MAIKASDMKEYIPIHTGLLVSFCNCNNILVEKRVNGSGIVGLCCLKGKC
jgi:hypothetical protein